MSERKGPKEKITREQLLEECKVLGTGRAAQRVIGEKYGLSYKTIENRMYRSGVYDEIHNMQASACEQIGSVKVGANDKEDVSKLTKRINKEIEIFEKNKKEAEIKAANKQIDDAEDAYQLWKSKINDEDTVSEFGSVLIDDFKAEAELKLDEDYEEYNKAEEVEFIARLPVSEDKNSLYYTPPKQPVLKPTQWRGAGRRYQFYDNDLTIFLSDIDEDYITISDLDTFIAELQELARMREVEK